MSYESKLEDFHIFHELVNLGLEFASSHVFDKMQSFSKIGGG